MASGLRQGSQALPDSTEFTFYVESSVARITLGNRIFREGRFVQSGNK